MVAAIQIRRDEIPAGTLYRLSPWEAIRDQLVYTQDEHDELAPYKPFPALPHIEQLCLDFMRPAHDSPVMFVHKSRRMMATWAIQWFACWRASLFQAALVCVQSTDATRSFEMLEKIALIIDNSDPAIWWGAPKGKPEYELHRTPKPYMRFPEIGSVIRGIPQGAAQLRGPTPNLVVGDEIAFWEKFSETYDALRPTLEGGGKFVGVSTGQTGDFERIFRGGRVDAKALRDPIIQPAQGSLMGPDDGRYIPQIEWAFEPDDEPIPQYRRAVAEDGTTLIQMHYTADPAKATVGFRKHQIDKGARARSTAREYDLRFEYFRGTAVYESGWNSDIHVRTCVFNPRFELKRGWDFGHNPSVAFCQVTPSGQLQVLAELVSDDMSLVDFLPVFRAFMASHFRDAKDVTDVGDPAGFAKNEQSKTSCADILRGHDIHLRRGAVEIPARLNAVDDLLAGTVGKMEPAFLIDPRCSVLIKAFGGGYFVDEDRVARTDTRIPAKNEYSHIMNALEYVAASLVRPGAMSVDDRRAAEKISQAHRRRSPTGV